MRRYPRIAQHVFGTPWAITPDKLEQIAFVVESRLEGVIFSKEDIAAAIDLDAEPAQIMIAGGVAIVPVFGVLDKRANMMSAISGGTSTDLLARDLASLAANPEVTAIVLDVDSPGGSVNAPGAVANLIAGIRGQKPIVAVANELAASAAYWIASAADQVVLSPTAGVGSIGVIAAFRETSAKDEKAGVKTTVLSAGKYKAAGHPSVPMDGEARAVLQERIDTFYGLFINAVAGNRRTSVDAIRSVADGRVYVGQQAIDAGLADRIGTIEQVVAELQARGQVRTGSQPNRTVFFSQETNPMGSTFNPANPSNPSAANPAPTPAVLPTPPAAAAPPAAPVVLSSADVDAAIARATAAEQTRICEITALVQAHANRIPNADQLRVSLISGNSSLDVARAQVLNAMVQHNAPVGSRPPAGTIEAGPAERTKFYEAVADGLALRVLGNEGAMNYNRDENGRLQLANFERRISGGRYDGITFRSETRAATPGASAFRGKRIFDIALLCLEREGVRTNGMSPLEVARLALGWDRVGIGASSNSSGGEYHTTGSFPNLVRDVANKTLLRAYAEAAQTWRMWVNIAESAPDFKTINRVGLGSASDLELVPEGMPFPQDGLADSREYYAVETRGKRFTYTREMLINDDLGALKTLARKYTLAAERTINKAVYAILTGSPAMRDGVALFHSSHNNVVSASGGVPSVAQLNKMQALHRTQTDPNNSLVKLNNELKFVIVPALLEGNAVELVQSTANPASSGNSGIKNIWQSRYTPVVESQLDLSSTAIWYTAGAYQDADHIEVAFLQGEESPVIEEEYCFNTKGRNFDIHQTFGVKAIDWVNLARNVGS